MLCYGICYYIIHVAFDTVCIRASALVSVKYTLCYVMLCYVAFDTVCIHALVLVPVWPRRLSCVCVRVRL
jgi:hypothetical protein